jgi:serine/threonine protein kinase
MTSLLLLSILTILFLPVRSSFVPAPRNHKLSVSTRKKKNTGVIISRYLPNDDEMEYWQRHHYWEEEAAHHRSREYLQVVQEYGDEPPPPVGSWSDVERELLLADMERQFIEFEQLNQNIIMEPMSPPHPRHSRSQQHPPPPPPLGRRPGPSLVNRPIPIQMLRTNVDFPAREVPPPQWSYLAKEPLPFEDATLTPSQRITSTILIPCSKNRHDPNYPPHVVLEDGRKFLVETIMDDVLVHQDRNVPRAYWLQSQISTAIHGQVRAGTILRKLKEPIEVKIPSVSENNGDEEESWTLIEWEATNEHVAVKQMNWDHILNEGQELAEDPIKEVACMEYMKKWTMATLSSLRPTTSGDDDDRTVDASKWSHVLMALDVLSDDQHLYTVTPFCEGGRLLDRIEGKNRFSEAEARFWMRQILDGLACLKEAGVSHKDLSPENLLVKDGNVFIIDMGMSLRIPFLNDRTNERSLIVPQGVCGKWYYLSPEVCVNEQPFDGPTVDLWAAGVILFMMLTGEPPWEEPKMTDANFRHIAAGGNLVQILTARRAGLSVDAMDLLQKMLWMDPADRLSLEQVMSHPWFSFVDKISFG